MRKIFSVLLLILGIGSAAFAEPVYVGKKVITTQIDGDIINTFVSYDENFDWDSIENVEEGALWDFYILQEEFNMHFEVGVTYTFHCRSDVQKVSGVLTFQRLSEDIDNKDGNWRYVITYTAE